MDDVSAHARISLMEVYCICNIYNGRLVEMALS